MTISKRMFVIGGAALVLSSLAVAQLNFKSLIKLVGVGAAVSKFGPDINKAINKLDGHTDSRTITTKVVPILTVGLSTRNAIGAAQVMGPKSKVDQVKAVAQLDQDILGGIKIRAMIPVSTEKIVQDVKRIEGVGISGIVDLKL